MEVYTCTDIDGYRAIVVAKNKSKAYQKLRTIMESVGSDEALFTLVRLNISDPGVFFL